MCSLSGKLCPGPIQGPLIVDMTASAKYGMKRQRTPNQAQFNMIHATRMNHVDMYHIGRDSIQEIAIEAFYANFLNHFTIKDEDRDIRNQLTWLQRLPALTTDRSNHALILALEATAIAYGAIMSSQTGLNEYAREIYGTALHAHHNILQRSRSKHDITVQAISTSVLLSFFEAMQATTADAYCTHIYGAAKLLEVTGPGECGQGVLCQLFYHIRTQMLFIQLASDYSDIPIASKRILSDTLLYKQPPLIQRLMCCISSLLDQRGSTLCMAVEEESACALLKLQIDQLWNEHSRQRGEEISGNDIVDKAVYFSDAFTALTLAYFGSANVTLAIRCPGSMDPTGLKHHAQLILEAAMYLDTGRNPIAFMRMATPLLLVALHGESLEHRVSAIDMFKTWSRRSMRGISALALDAVYRQVGKSTQHAGLRQVSRSSTHDAVNFEPGGNSPTPERSQ